MICLERISNFNANEQCFKRLKDTFNLETTAEHIFLDTTQLVNLTFPFPAEKKL